MLFFCVAFQIGDERFRFSPRGENFFSPAWERFLIRLRKNSHPVEKMIKPMCCFDSLFRIILCTHAVNLFQCYPFFFCHIFGKSYIRWQFDWIIPCLFLFHQYWIAVFTVVCMRSLQILHVDIMRLFSYVFFIFININIVI